MVESSRIRSATFDVGKVIKDLKRFFYTEAIAGTLLEWIVNKEKHDRQQTIDYISVIFRTGLLLPSGNIQTRQNKFYDFNNLKKLLDNKKYPPYNG